MSLPGATGVAAVLQANSKDIRAQAPCSLSCFPALEAQRVLAPWGLRLVPASKQDITINTDDIIAKIAHIY